MHAPVSEKDLPPADYARNKEGKILACIGCRGPLVIKGGGPYCEPCKLHWAEITLVAVSANA
jgi:hypothetical protein